MQMARAGEQAAVVIVYESVERIIIGIEASCCAQQLHLVGHASFLKQTDGVGRVFLNAVEGQIGFDEFGHALRRAVQTRHASAVSCRVSIVS